LVVCATAKYVAAIIPFTLGVVYVIQNGYLRTSRQLRYLDIEAKAPIYTLFVETLEGLATIRAFGWKDPLQRRNHLLVDGAQKPFHLLNCIQRWLGFVLDMLLAVVSVLVVVFAVKFKSQTTGASTGVALVNVLACHQHLAGFVQRWAMLETSIGAVSRIRAFAIECPIETRQNTMTVPPKWPTEGKIEFINISASYRFVTLIFLVMDTLVNFFQSRFISSTKCNNIHPSWIENWNLRSLREVCIKVSPRSDFASNMSPAAKVHLFFVYCRCWIYLMGRLPLMG